MLVFIVLSTLIAIKTPAWESYDEPGHVQNIETLASGHWFGMRSDCAVVPSVPYFENCSGDEAHQPPLYYLILAGWQWVAGISVHPPYQGQLNPGIYSNSGPAELYAHHSAADHRFLLWLRLPNVLLGTLTVLMAFLVARLISKDAWSPVVAAALVAFLPGMIFHSAFVTNDNLVMLLGSGLTYLALRFVKAPGIWTMVGAGAVVGLLVTTKFSSTPMAVVLITMACIVAGWRRRIGMAMVGGLAALATSGWYLIQNAVRYGDPLERHAASQYLKTIGSLGTGPGRGYSVTDPARLAIVEVPQRLVETFWYTSDWNAFHWSTTVNWLFCIGAILALLGLVGRHYDSHALIMLAVISAAALGSVWITAFQTNGYGGRFAYVGLTAMATLAALGLERWRLQVRFLLPAAGLVGIVLAVQMNVLSVHWT